ncbi:hypothetical protein N9101_03220, partial [Akkermansiaceae bacterium]|nr:hypothetical protein [Akkermansiaceae bacterium]
YVNDLHSRDSSSRRAELKSFKRPVNAEHRLRHLHPAASIGPMAVLRRVSRLPLLRSFRASSRDDLLR